MTKPLRCPICGRSFDPTTSDGPPFCSNRCRQIDLGRWLGEGYAFPTACRDDDGEMPDDEEA